MRYRGDPSTATGCGCRYAPSRVGEVGENWCGRWESNPHEEKSPEDFHAVYGFRRPDAALRERLCPVCGLDYPFTVSRKVRGLGAARLVSTHSRLDSFAGLGSGLPLQVSPNLSSSASPVSRRALKFC